MDIDIERLKTDAEYWLDNDPSDGEATHFELEYSGHECAWVRVDRKGLRHYFLDGGWVCADMTNDDIGPVDRMIPRPAKPAAPEWDGEGFPPVGCECEYRPDPHNDEWQRCAYLAHFNGEHFVLVLDAGEVDRMPDKTPASIRFRLALTNEQRLREELACCLGESMGLRHDFYAGADAILSRYNLEPKDA